jgi:O-antigen/teichoic acid export membrane protein
MLQRLKAFLFKNETAKQTIAKNTVWLVISNFGGRLIKAAIIIYSARVLGTAGWGVFSYAVTLAGFFTFLIDPGVNAIVMREVPKAEKEGKLNILSTTLAMKIVFIAASAAIILTAGSAFSTLPGAKALLPIVVLIIAFDTMREFFSSFIRAMEKMEWEAGIFLLTNLTIVIAGFLFLSYSPTAKAFGWAYAAGTAVGAITAMFVLRRHLKNIFSYFSARLIAPIMRSAWPFAITGTLGILLTNTDILIISWMRSASDVGIYSAAIRIVQVLYLIPVILQYSTMPLLARLANRDNEKFRRTLERAIGLIFLASVPIALGGALLGTEIMRLIFGQAFAPGGLSFSILMITMLVDYPAAIISGAIFAYNHQKSLIITSAIGGVMNVVFDLILIPPYGIAGSAVATLIAQIASNWYLWHMMKKINRFEVAPKLKAIVAAGIVMAFVTALFLALHVNAAVNVVLSAGVYFAMLIMLREPLLKEMFAVVTAKTGVSSS